MNTIFFKKILSALDRDFTHTERKQGKALDITTLNSKLQKDKLNECVKGVLNYAKKKKSNFLETVELQVALKKYDTTKDKRFSGTLRLKHIARPNMKICVVADHQHIDEANAMNIPCLDAEALKKLKGNKKLLKQFGKKYNGFLVSESLIKYFKFVLSAELKKGSNCTIVLLHTDSITKRIEELKSTELSLSAAVGHVDMTPIQLAENVHHSVYFLVSLLKDHWGNVKRIHMKSSMGPSHRLV